MTLYRGGIGQWSWVAHRVTGVGVLLFLIAHILDTALIMLGPEMYNKVIAIYRLPLFGLGEIGLFAAVLYHALNGIRITIVDFFPDTVIHYKRMFAVQMVSFALVFLPVAWVMIGHILHGGASP